MTLQTMHGGPFNGRVVNVAEHTWEVVFPMVRAGGPAGSGRSARNFAELYPEVEVDPETLGIIAPPDLVLEAAKARYVRTADGFRFDDARGGQQPPISSRGKR